MKKVVMASICCAAFCGVLFTKPAPPMAMSDQDFVDFAAQTDMTEAHLGQLAKDQAAGDAVKTYADSLVTDHTSDYKQLSAVATKASLTVPKGLDAAHDKMIAPFEKLKGKAFDARYEHEMIMGHEKALAAYKKEASDGQNAALKDYATQTLPTLEKHLQGAKDLMKPAGIM